jgi:hypothetical protein
MACLVTSRSMMTEMHGFDLTPITPRITSNNILLSSIMTHQYLPHLRLQAQFDRLWAAPFQDWTFSVAAVGGALSRPDLFSSI